MTYAVLYLRPDGWWVADDGWPDEESAKRDAGEQLPGNAKWKVVTEGSDEHRAAVALEAAES